MNINYFFFKKKRTSKSFFWRNCVFVNENVNNQLQIHSRDFNNREHTQKTFCQQKREKKCPTIFLKNKSHFLKRKDNRTRTKLREAESFFFVLNGGKKPLHHDKNIEHSIDLLQISTVAEHTCNLGELVVVITHGNVVNLWHHDNFLHIVEQHHVRNDQLDPPDYGLVSSVIFIWLLFVSVSPSVLFDHFHTSSFRVNHAVIFFQ